MRTAAARDLATPWPSVRGRMAAIPDEPPRGPARKALHSRVARDLALDLLREAGVAVDDIGKAPDGQPIWPAGWVGSLAHTSGAAVAVVAPAADCAGIGIDLEPDEPLPQDAATLVLRDEEKPRTSYGPRGGGSPDDVRVAPEGRDIFCAKECVHKAVFPANGVFLDFLDVRIIFGADRCRFTPEAATPKAAAALAGRHFEGVMSRHGGYVLALLRMT